MKRDKLKEVAGKVAWKRIKKRKRKIKTKKLWVAGEKWEDEARGVASKALEGIEGGETWTGGSGGGGGGGDASASSWCLNTASLRVSCCWCRWCKRRVQGASLPAPPDILPNEFSI